MHFKRRILLLEKIRDERKETQIKYIKNLKLDGGQNIIIGMREKSSQVTRDRSEIYLGEKR